jgi:15-cis-phytoene synthase
MNLNQLTKEKMQKGSKSFAFAAKLLPRSSREGARYLYAWCRYCDDEIDQAGTNGSQKLQELEEKTRIALSDDPKDLDFVFQSFREVMKKYEIPSIYAFDLLKGMRMDLDERTYSTIEELEVYCYHVASTVGLMMCHILGLSDSKALSLAAQMGIAMQLTNISRDVKEDLALGRVYLPQAWLEEEGIFSRSEILEQPEKTLKVIDRVLDQADFRYAAGCEGLPFLHWRVALAIRVAANIYRGIGTEIREKKNIHHRAHTTKFTKLKLALDAMKLSIVDLPLRKPFQKTSLSVWRPL